MDIYNDTNLFGYPLNIDISKLNNLKILSIDTVLLNDINLKNNINLPMRQRRGNTFK